VLVYGNTLSAPFILDDEESITLNEQIRQLWPPSVVLFPAREVPTAGRPVANVSLAVNYAVGGLDVRGYHIVNIGIHIACALVLFGIVRRTLLLPALEPQFGASSANLAGAAALLWLVHPLQTEAVNYVTQRTELLMGLFYLLTLYATLRIRQGIRWQVVAIVCCLLGVASKESMATAPLMVVLFDRTFVFGSFAAAWRARWRFYVGLAASWVLLAALIWSGPRSRSAGFSTGVTPWTYLLNQAQLIVHYLRLTFWPGGLVILYGNPRPLTVGDVLPQMIVIVALLGAVILALVKRPKIGFLGAWFFVTLAPTSSLVPIATEVGAERRMYLPLAAIVVLMVMGAALFWERLRQNVRSMADQTPDAAGSRSAAANRSHTGNRSAAANRSTAARRSVRLQPDGTLFIGFALLTVVTVALAATTVARNREYSSAVSLARTVVSRWPTPRAQHWLGAELLAAGDHDEGIANLRQALAGDPRVHYTLGMALFKDGQDADAIDHLRAFVRAEPLRIEVPVAHEAIGRALEHQGHYAEAANELRLALRMTPGNNSLHAILGEVLFRQEKFDESIGEYRQFLARRPADVDALLNLGISYVGAGRSDEAIAAFRRAVEIDPRHPGAERNLARALIEARKFADALPHAEAAVRLAPNDAVALDELGLALAGLRRFEEAIDAFKHSLVLDPADADVHAHLAAVDRVKDGIIAHP
jgi:tetratricopeptide (TPR) repeat protein